MDLTKRQQEIFDFIRKYSAKYGYPPTVRDIGKAVGLASSSTVHAHLANLEKIGLLRRDPSKPRAIELLDRAVGNAVDSVRGIVAPGGPAAARLGRRGPADAGRGEHRGVRLGARDRRRRRRRVPAAHPRRIDEGRRHPRGRLRRRASAGDGRDGDIVVALLGEEATVKRFFREADHIRLQPENEAMEPIRSKEVKVLGRVVGLLRQRLTATSGRRPPRDAASDARRSTHGRRSATLTGAGQAAAEAVRPSRKVRTSKGRVVEESTRGNPRESATETNRLSPPSHVNGGPARVKWCGKSAPAPR